MDQDRRRKALIPVSLGNDRFSSENLVNALSAIPTPYDEFTFVIANNIQLYNRARRISDPAQLGMTIAEFANGRALFTERSKWLERVRNRVPPTVGEPVWRVLSFDDLVETGLSTVFRNVLVTYAAVKEFRHDVDVAARDYVGPRQPTLIDSDLFLSRAYILEETAASITLHVLCHVQSEYYLGAHIPAIIKLYSGDYGIDVFTLANAPRTERSFDFFSYDSTGNMWRLVRST